MPSLWASMWKRWHLCEDVDATLTAVTRPFALIVPFALGRSLLRCEVTARIQIPCNVTLGLFLNYWGSGPPSTREQGCGARGPTCHLSCPRPESGEAEAAGPRSGLAC